VGSIPQPLFLEPKNTMEHLDQIIHGLQAVLLCLNIAIAAKRLRKPAPTDDVCPK